METMEISSPDLIMSVSKAIDLISPIVVHHQLKVAYVASSLASVLGYSEEKKWEILLAGMLHDSGVTSYKEKMRIMSFDVQNPHHHAKVGYMLLSLFKPFSRIAELVRFHHVPWEDGRGREFEGLMVPSGSHLLHIADRVVILVSSHREILKQRQDIVSLIKAQSGNLFVPGLVEAFLEVSGKESFWLDINYPSLDTLLNQEMRRNGMSLGTGNPQEMTRLFSRVIDFRSPFTATHSCGVSASAESISRLAGFSDERRNMMKIAGHLHDIGKLSVPAEILNKPAPLTKEEFNVILGHTYYTYRVLEPIPAFAELNQWASYHHEQLDGGGYPFHLKAPELSTGSRIMSVSDIFAAITEDRPYRKGMKKESALNVLDNMARGNKIDKSIVEIVAKNYDEINSARIAAQETSMLEYTQFVAPQLDQGSLLAS